MQDEAPERDDRAAPGAESSKRLLSLLRKLASAPAVDPFSRWSSVLRPGAVIGRFELLRELGRGGFGVVWEARDRELGRTVAFKALASQGGAPSSADRLPREAEAAAYLSHPNIVTLYDAGCTAQGPYLVLELLKGETLGRRLGRGPIQPQEAVRIALGIARGLAHAHAQGVVHRDLTPGNVFLCEGGWVKLLDLGMAHAFGLKRIDGGTPAFMAPEQGCGAPEDERTDVFALGVLLYCMLSGELPFGVDAREGQPAAELEVREAPGLGRLVSRMLERDPVRRPRNGGEVLAALSELQGSATGSGAAPSAAAVRKRRRLPLRLAFGLLALGAIIAAAWWARRPKGQGPPAPRAVTLAVLPFVNASGDKAQEFLSDGITEEIAHKLSCLPGLAVTARTSASRYKNSERSAQEIGAELGVAFVLTGKVEKTERGVHVGAALFRTADGSPIWSDASNAALDDLFRIQAEVAAQIARALHVELSPREAQSLGSFGTSNPAAYLEYLRGRGLIDDFHPPVLVEARDHFERAAQIDPQFAEALAALASAETRVFRHADDRPEHLERARELLKRALAIDPGQPRALFVSGEILGASFDYAGAAEVFRQVVAREPRNDFAWDSLCWALGYSTPLKLAEAEEACRRAIEINPASDGPHYHLLRAFALSGRRAEAEQAFAHLEKNFPNSFSVRTGRFWLALGTGQPRAALDFLEREHLLEGTALGFAWRALAHAKAGDVDRSLARLDEALAHGYRDGAGLRGDPSFEGLRRDPRFAALLARYGLSAAPLATATAEPQK